MTKDNLQQIYGLTSLAETVLSQEVISEEELSALDKELDITIASLQPKKEETIHYFKRLL